jgi:hypothetical protein
MCNQRRAGLCETRSSGRLGETVKSILPPQPPPNAPAPPPGDESEDSRLKWKMICVVGWVAIAFALYLLIFVLPASRKQSRRLQSEARSNLKQLHLALLDFDSDYGAFPDVSTIPDVKADTGTTLALGSGSSNELLRQLIATVCKAETIFWVRTPATPNRPNNILGTDALNKGECAFAYITAELSSSADSAAPVLITPAIPGTWKFDPKPFDGKAMALRIDGSVTAEPIDKHGNVMIGGMNLFDPRQPYWRGKTPDIKWPE